MIAGQILLEVDRWFAWLYRQVGHIVRVAVFRPENPKRILIIKFMGMGSLVQLANHCDRLGIDKSCFVLLTRSSHRSICALLGFTQTWYITSIAPLTIIDLIGTLIKAYRWKPELIVDMERCSNVVGIFRTFLAFAGHSYCVSFEANRSLQLPNQEIHAADQLTMHQLFGIGLRLLPRITGNRHPERWSPLNNRILINLNASPYLLTRRLPTHQLDALLRELKRTLPSAEFFLTGTANERHYVQQVADQTPGFRLQNVAGLWTLDQLQKELASCRLFITGDSGPLHLAVRLGTPAVVVWGPTQPAHFGYDNNTRVFSISQHRACAPCLTHPHSKPMVACGGKADCMNHFGIKVMMTASLKALEATSGVSCDPISH